ncbi:MAG: ATP-binding cassette domain-containing protein [Cyclobacteriaceae bacterium]|nr:ATP-binding cassette domain-containing protein [Cyclobacteriaceae bacterium HetDA_MAG_MS6]
MTDILRIDNLNKHFGRIKAVQSLNLEVKAGQVYGLLGPNGSGKTTTLGMILDVVAPSSGTFEWFGGKANVDSRKQIGAILETPCFYPYLNAIQNLKIIAHIKECSNHRIEEVLLQVGLLERKTDQFKAYSLGMKQRLSIAAALLSNPPVLILDEPTNGLDPQGIAEVRVLIQDIADQGKTIILASHLLDEVQKVCTHFCVLRKGEKLHEGPVSDILGETNAVELVSDNQNQLEGVLKDFKGAVDIHPEKDQLVLELADGISAADVNQYCFEKQIVLKKLVTRKNSLEEEFLKILKEHDQSI